MDIQSITIETRRGRRDRKRSDAIPSTYPWFHSPWGFRWFAHFPCNQIDIWCVKHVISSDNRFCLISFFSNDICWTRIHNRSNRRISCHLSWNFNQINWYRASERNVAQKCSNRKKSEHKRCGLHYVNVIRVGNALVDKRASSLAEWDSGSRWKQDNELSLVCNSTH